MHYDCLQWSPMVYEENGRWMNVTAEVFRGRQLRCAGCGETGATLGCEVCRSSYHVPCAHVAACGFDETAFTIRCPEHAWHALVVIAVLCPLLHSWCLYTSTFLPSFLHSWLLLLFRTTPTCAGCARMVGLCCLAMAVAAALSTWAASACKKCRVQTFGSVGPVIAGAYRLAAVVRLWLRSPRLQRWSGGAVLCSMIWVNVRVVMVMLILQTVNTARRAQSM